MTEVPEHLLRRSRERRAALGLGGDAEAGGAPETDAEPAAAAPAAGSLAASSAPAASAALEEASRGGAVAVLEEPPPPRLVPTRAKTPFWVMPVLFGLPIYAFIYFGAFGSRSAAGLNDPVARGNIVFHSAGCSGCHGANGEGGVGPKLAGAEAVKTFPILADQINWVKTGSAPFTGKKYGDPNRPGGQHGPATGGMPAFGGSLSDQQISDVVAYERQGL